MLRLSSRIRLLLGAMLVCVACSGGGTEPSRQTPGLHFVAGSGASDTIGAVLPQALAVEVRDENGQVVPGVVVRFESISSSPAYGAWETLVGGLDQATRGTFVSVTTDSRGQAMAIVQLGNHVGVARTAIMAPVYGFVDTAEFTVRPGNAARITLDVRDTVVNVGAAYRLGAAVSDRFGNPRPTDVLTYAPTSNVESVDATGGLKALAIGRGAVAIRAGTFTDTAWTSVVPDLTLAVISGRSARAVGTIKLDGSQFTSLSPTNDAVLMPRWSPTGTRIAFYDGDPNSGAQVHTMDLQGNRSPFPNPRPTDSRAEFFPRYSADGQWVYFTGLPATSYAWDVWRARVDGSGAEVIASSPGVSYREASPSPDGARVVFTAGSVISTIDLATRTITSLNVAGDFPEYSPDGTKILFLAGSGDGKQLAVMNADGSNVRTLASRTYGLYASPSWSPDGKWIVVGGTSFVGTSITPDLVNAATFEVIPLTTLRGIEQAAIKP
jgi:hypothetical protein